MEQKKKTNEYERRKEEQQQIFLEGLNRYRSKGVKIFIDGEKCEPEDFRKLFEVREDNSFYMGDYDYIRDEQSGENVLSEIRFDRVSHH